MSTSYSSSSVIIAGDVPFLRALLKMAIQDAGFEISGEVSDGSSLLELCATKNPDIVVMDLELPVDEAIRLIESILDINSRVSIVAISDVASGLSEIAFAVGARGFLQKPFTIHDLIDMIKKVTPVY
ncbi:MAG: response regulator [Candidatus Lokiarchaeota archaeon]|nr:response regulator [Candidatus Lokiarchaeota archaeon]